MGQVVIKLFADWDEKTEQRYQREIALLRRLTDLPQEARVVRLSEAMRPDDCEQRINVVGVPTGCRYMALAPAWDTDVEAQITGGLTASFLPRYDLSTALRWGLQVAQSLRLLHVKAGVCHGELNPRNVVLGGPRLDAYLSAVSIPALPGCELDERVNGYIACVAPEIQEGRCKRFEPSSEVWSFGVLFYCILARSLDGHSKPDPLSFFETLTSSCDWADAIHRAWAPVEVPSAALDVIVGTMRRNPVERMGLQTVIRRLRRAVRHGVASCSSAEDLTLGEECEPLPPAASANMGEDWLEVVCQCDDRLFSQRHAPQPDGKAMGEDLVRKGWAHQKMRQYGDAEQCYQAAVSNFRTSFDNVDYNGIATALNNLASVHLEKGEEGKALLLQEAVLRMRRHVLAANDPAIASFLTNLASLYELRKEYDKAMPLYDEAAEILRAVLPADHPDIATAINNIAVLHQTRGDFDVALPLHQEALAIRRAALPKEHPLLAASLTSLAMVYYCRNDREAALPLLEEALEIQRSSMAGQQPEGGVPGLALHDLEAIYELIRKEVDRSATGEEEGQDHEGSLTNGSEANAAELMMVNHEGLGRASTVLKKRRGRPPGRGRGKRAAAQRRRTSLESSSEEEQEEEEEEEEELMHGHGLPHDDDEYDDEPHHPHLMPGAADVAMMMPPVSPVGLVDPIDFPVLTRRMSSRRTGKV